MKNWIRTGMKALSPSKKGKSPIEITKDNVEVSMASDVFDGDEDDLKKPQNENIKTNVEIMTPIKLERNKKHDAPILTLRGSACLLENLVLPRDTFLEHCDPM